MRNGKLEIGEFGPLGYVLAHEVAKAEAVAAFSDNEGKAVYLLGEPRDLSGVRHQIGRGYPRTLLCLFRSCLDIRPFISRLGLRKDGLDPDKDVKGIYAGSHAASFEALYNRKVDAGELNSEERESATQRGHYKDGDMVFLWKSDAIPTDPSQFVAIFPRVSRSGSPKSCRTLDLSDLPEADRKIMEPGVSLAWSRRPTRRTTKSATW